MYLDLMRVKQRSQISERTTIAFSEAFNSLPMPPRLSGCELKRFYRYRVITGH